MKVQHLQLTLILAGCLFVAGCQTFPVVPHAIRCEVDPELLAGKCATPRQIANDTNYATLVDTMQTDRKSLRECGATADALRDALQRCNQATDEYNKMIDTLNKAK